MLALSMMLHLQQRAPPRLLSPLLRLERCPWTERARRCRSPSSRAIRHEIREECSLAGPAATIPAGSQMIGESRPMSRTSDRSHDDSTPDCRRSPSRP